MNKVRILGLILLILGIVLHFSLKNVVPDFITGLVVGVGIGLLLTGRVGGRD